MYKISQVAKLLALSPSKIYALVDTGKLGHYRMDGSIRVSEEQVQEYLERTRREPAAPQTRASPRRELKHIRL